VSVIGESLLKDADRVADRLRTMLPRLLGRTDDRAGRELLAAARTTLQALADAAATAQGRTARAVPEVRVLAVPDQLLLLAHELVAGEPEPGAFAGPAAGEAALERAIAEGSAALGQLRDRL
jgi:hypothetical protein